MTVSSRVVKTFLEVSPDAVDVPLMNNLRVQILPRIENLANAKKNQNAAFIASEKLLVVWDDDAMNLMPRAKQIEEELLRLVMGTGVDEKDEFEDGMTKKGPQVVETELDEETGEYISKRPTNIMNSNLVSVTLCLIIILLGLGLREIAVEIKVDMDYTRLAFLALTPVQIFFTLVSGAITLRGIVLTIVAVLCPSYCRLYSSMYRPSQTRRGELQVLLWLTASSYRATQSSSRYHSVPCLQGRP